MKVPGIRRYLTSSAVGIVATTVSWACLIAEVELLGLSKSVANITSLLVGSSIQFLGNRQFTFQRGTRRVSRQALLFVLVESVALTLNSALFEFFVRSSLIRYELARPVCNFLSFTFYSFPMWHYVFKPGRR